MVPLHGAHPPTLDEASVSAVTSEFVAASLSPPPPGTSSSYQDRESPLWQTWRRLLVSLSSSWEPEALIGRCIDAYMVHLFPITPLVHERSLRAIWSWAFGHRSMPRLYARSSSSQLLSTAISTAPRISRHEQQSVNYSEAQALTLVTALCAACSCLIPETILHKARTVALPFLQTSREMLRLYLDVDIEHPSANSVIIRYYQAISVHAIGNASVSWYLIGEAIRLAQEIRLYDENSVVTSDVVETSLRRAVFWQLYTGDQSAAILNNRPLMLHRRMLDMSPSTRYLSGDDMHLLGSGRYTPDFALQITSGFNLCLSIWSSATDVVLDLKLLEEFSNRSAGSADLVRGLTASIVDSALTFHTVLDDLPSCLRHPGQVGSSASTGRDSATVDSVIEHQQISFWAQHVNLMVTYSCLRLILLQKSTDLGVASLLGFSEDPRLLAMQKTEISRDVLACIQAVPFGALQVNGESCVEKIRQVGACLLQVSHGLEPRIAARAKADFQVLLNLLARLDSKASDALYRDVGSN